MDYDKVRPEQIKMMLECDEYIPECILKKIAELEARIVLLEKNKVNRTPIVPVREYKEQELPETD